MIRSFIPKSRLSNLLGGVAVLLTAAMGCGSNDVMAPVEPPAVAGFSTADIVVGERKFALVPSTITIKAVPMVPALDGVKIYIMYAGPGLPAGDPGVQTKVATTTAPAVFMIPGMVSVTRGITTLATVDGKPVPAGKVLQGIEGKVIMPDGSHVAGELGYPTDNQAVRFEIGGSAVAPLSMVTYTAAAGVPVGTENFYVPPYLLGATP